MGRVIRLTESEFKNFIQEQVDNTINLAVLGYLSLYGANLLNDPQNRERNIALRNEVIQYLKAKRDGQMPRGLSMSAQDMLNKLVGEVNRRTNKPELMQAGATA